QGKLDRARQIVLRVASTRHAQFRQHACRHSVEGHSIHAGHSRQCLQPLDHTRWIAERERTWRNVGHDDASGPDHGTLANRHAGQNDRSVANPDTIADDNRFWRWLDVVVDRIVEVIVHNEDVRPDHDVRTDLDKTSRDNVSAVIDGGVVTNDEPAPRMRRKDRTIMVLIEPDTIYDTDRTIVCNHDWAGHAHK